MAADLPQGKSKRVAPALWDAISPETFNREIVMRFDSVNAPISEMPQRAAQARLPDGVHLLSEESAAILARAHQRAREAEQRHTKRGS